MAPAWVPGRRGRGPRERDGGARPGAHERGRSPAATSIPENGPRPTIPRPATSARVWGPATRAVHPGTENHRPVRGRVPPRTTVHATRLACAAILPAAPRPHPDRQAQQKNAAPTAGTLSSRRVLASTAARSGSPGSADRHRSSSSPRSIVRPSRASPTTCLPAAHTTVIVPSRGVPAERRQESCRFQTNGAQRASRHRSLRLIAFAIMRRSSSPSAAWPTPRRPAAAGIKVVVVVGPVGSSTARIPQQRASSTPQLARSYGASVTEIYSPNATWSRVKSAAQGANIFIYLGHGNGYPSPYGAFQPYTQGRPRAERRRRTAATRTSKYYGENYIDRDIQMAKNAVVILNRLCYASGNSEWGSANPTKATAMKRVDNYGAGFLRAGARAVFAEAHHSVVHQIRALFKSNMNMNNILMTHPNAKRQPRLLLLLVADPRCEGPSRSAAGRQVLAIRHRLARADRHPVARRGLTPDRPRRRPPASAEDPTTRPGPRGRVSSCPVAGIRGRRRAPRCRAPRG